jgi:ribonuclease H2 subunit B
MTSALITSGQPQLYIPYTSSSGAEAIVEVCKVGGAGVKRRTWFIGDSTIDGECCRYVGIGTSASLENSCSAGNFLVHHRIDPIFLVIPIIEHLAKRVSPLLSDIVRQLTTQHAGGSASFQPLSDLVASATASPAFAVAPPFTAPGVGASKSETDAFNPDLARLLEIKSVRRTLRLCCDRKGAPT